MRSGSLLESVLKHDRAVIAVGIAVIAALAWAYLAYLALKMGEVGAGMAMPRMGAWTAADFGLMFLMWSVMMAGMMIPSASPMVLMFATINRSRREAGTLHTCQPDCSLSAYILVWTAFAGLATLANWVLHSSGLLTSMMGASTSNYLGGGLLDCGGSVPMEPLEVGLSQPLPVAHVLPR